MNFGQNKNGNQLIISYRLLSHQDSNLGKQNQNLMCYHYTMGQRFRSMECSKSGCKSTKCMSPVQIFLPCVTANHRSHLRNTTCYTFNFAILSRTHPCLISNICSMGCESFSTNRWVFSWWSRRESSVAICCQSKSAYSSGTKL